MPDLGDYRIVFDGTEYHVERYRESGFLWWRKRGWGAIMVSGYDGDEMPDAHSTPELARQAIVRYQAMDKLAQ